MILIESLVAGGCAIRHRVLHTPITSGLVLRKQLWGHGVLGSAWAVLGPSQKIPTPYMLEYLSTQAGRRLGGQGYAARFR